MLYNFYVDLDFNKYKFHYTQDNNGTIYNFNYHSECLVYDFYFITELRKLYVLPQYTATQKTHETQTQTHTGKLTHNKIGINNKGEYALLATAADLPRNPTSNKKIGFTTLTLPNQLKCYSNGEYKQTIELKPNQHYSKNGVLIRTTDNTLYIEDQFGLYDTYFTTEQTVKLELYHNQSATPISSLEPQTEHLSLNITLNEWSHIKQKLNTFMQTQIVGYSKLSVQTALEHLLIHSYGFLPTKLFVWFKWEVEGELQRSKHIQNQTQNIIQNFIQNLQYQTIQHELHNRKVVV